MVAVVEDAPDLVTLREGVDPAEVRELIAEVEGAGATVKARLGKDFPGFTGTLTPRAERILRDHPAVDLVDDNAVFTNAGIQDDAPWHLDRIDQVNRTLDGRYTFGTAKRHSNGKGVRIYVVDSGVRATHVQLRGRVGKGASAIGRLSPRKDCSGHGTHVAGLAAGRASGVAKSATIVPVRIFGCGPQTSARNVIRGINWVTKNHRKPAVMNLSLAGPPNPAVTRAVRRALKRGVHVVAAAGNDRIDACRVSPARMMNVITVGALNRQDRMTSFSNRGPCVDVWAPGQNLRSATHRRDRGTRAESGTSMAAPLVAGTLARMLQVQRKLRPVAARRALVAATPLQDRGDGYLQPVLFSGVRDDVHRAANPARVLTTNPGFEQGAAGWEATTPDLITDDPMVLAANGTWKAVLGGAGVEGSSGIRQQLTVPVNARRAWASFRLQVLTDEPVRGAYDQLAVLVYNASGDRVIGELGYFSNQHAAGHFARYEVNLRQFRGRSIHLAFVAIEDESLPTTFVIDDVYATVQ
ncbi:S8 family peptidase [Nocardioides massiliensis]|uniref:S8 family peptidase n=1 Tax=Nocardioides massiliensis TaxID=1325935 RepID=UPI000829C44A|nr:S8 family peptidase [Nocardioides massiliensis]